MWDGLRARSNQSPLNLASVIYKHFFVVNELWEVYEFFLLLFFFSSSNFLGFFFLIQA